MKNYKVGYTTGVYDLFHIGHLNLLRKAKEQCDFLIVGVSTDALVREYKHKSPVIPFEERVAIVDAIKYVDKVIPQTSMDKLSAWNELKFDVVFLGDDWKNTPKWIQYEQDFAKIGVEVVYFPYTQGTSSTKLIQALEKINQG